MRGAVPHAEIFSAYHYVGDALCRPHAVRLFHLYLLKVSTVEAELSKAKQSKEKAKPSNAKSNKVSHVTLLCLAEAKQSKAMHSKAKRSKAK